MNDSMRPPITSGLYLDTSYVWLSDLDINFDVMAHETLLATRTAITNSKICIPESFLVFSCFSFCSLLLLPLPLFPCDGLTLLSPLLRLPLDGLLLLLLLMRKDSVMYLSAACWRLQNAFGKRRITVEKKAFDVVNAGVHFLD